MDIEFQSTFPRGERRLIPTNYHIGRVFQSTFPRGERPMVFYQVMANKGFNPRSHEGNDAADPREQHGDHSFNPRSHEGNDGLYATIFDAPARFQSTFPRGERQQSSINFLYISCYYLCNYINIIPAVQVHLPCSSHFLLILRCESPRSFMSTSFSHQSGITLLFC